MTTVKYIHAEIIEDLLQTFIHTLDFNHAYSLIFEYIEAFYNTKRIHSHCGYLSPDDFEKLYNASVARESLLVS
nr:IS3 family transposase [Selenomonas ruminantium]